MPGERAARHLGAFEEPPGRLSVWMLRMRATSASVAGLLPLANSAISLRISAMAGPVLSICTGAIAIHGRWPTVLLALVRAP